MIHFLAHVYFKKNMINTIIKVFEDMVWFKTRELGIDKHIINLNGNQTNIWDCQLNKLRHWLFYYLHIV